MVHENLLKADLQIRLVTIRLKVCAGVRHSFQLKCASCFVFIIVCGNEISTIRTFSLNMHSVALEYKAMITLINILGR